MKTISTADTMLNPIFSDYMTICEADLSPTTLASYRVAFKDFDEYLLENQIEFALITHQEVQGYIFAHSHLKRSTLITRIKAVRAAWRYAKNCLLVIERYDDPFVRLRYPQMQDVEPVTYSDEEMKRLYDAIQNDREWLVFHIFAYSGLRRAEACNLRWEDVDFESRMLTVQAGKGNKTRRVPLHPRLQQALAEARQTEGYVLPTMSHSSWTGNPAGSKLDPDALWRSNNEWFNRAGVNKGNHAFRRTAASVLREKGVSGSDIDAIFGWAPRDIAGRHYTRHLNETLHTAVSRIDYKLHRKQYTRV